MQSITLLQRPGMAESYFPPDLMEISLESPHCGTCKINYSWNFYQVFTLALSEDVWMVWWFYSLWLSPPTPTENRTLTHCTAKMKLGAVDPLKCSDTTINNTKIIILSWKVVQQTQSKYWVHNVWDECIILSEMMARDNQPDTILDAKIHSQTHTYTNADTHWHIHTAQTNRIISLWFPPAVFWYQGAAAGTLL